VSSTRIQFGIPLLTSFAVEELENSPAVEELILIPPPTPDPQGATEKAQIH
jgi:hypothetical protein